jgi:hypothetical protein
MNERLKINIKRELKNLIDEESLVNEAFLPISKKMTKSFRRYYYESLLVEAPWLQLTEPEVMFDNWAINGPETMDYINEKKGKFIGYFKFRSKNVSIYVDEYSERNRKIYEYALIFNEKKAKCTVGFVRIIRRNIEGQEYVFTKGLWNNKTYASGLIFAFLIESLLPKYGTIISDNLTTKLGKDFWLKIVAHCLANNKECGIFTEPKTLKDFRPIFTKLSNEKDFQDAWKNNGGTKRLYIKV